MELSIRGVPVTVDVSATRAAYAEITASKPEVCECAFCTNFRALGASVFPWDVLQSLVSAGIDVVHIAEPIKYDETRPGYHLYGGEYCFFGSAPRDEVSSRNPSGQFEFWFSEPSPLVQEQFARPGAVCFNFTVELPWVIAAAP